MLGWSQVQGLANELFALSDATVLTKTAVDKIITLWEKLPAAFQQSRVLYPPRYRDDKAHTGRFMQRKTTVATHTETITPGIVSLKRRD